MAENDPNAPPGAVPPKPSEAAKVQPKKETVRISLPPKPAATIKLPTLPGGAPPPSAAGSAAAKGPPAPPKPPTSLPGAPAGPRPATAAPAFPQASRPAAAAGLASRPGVVPAAKPMSFLDGALAVVAAVIGLVAVYWVWNLLSMN